MTVGEMFIRFPGGAPTPGGAAVVSDGRYQHHLDVYSRGPGYALGQATVVVSGPWGAQELVYDEATGRVSDVPDAAIETPEAAHA